MKRTLKPEATYSIDANITREDIKRAYISGGTLTGKVIKYDVSRRILEVDLGNGNKGILPWSETTVYKFTYSKLSDVADIPRQIIAILYKKVRVKVFYVNEHCILLSRRKNMIEAFEHIISNEEKVYTGVVVGKYKYGAFYDVGEGITAFCHVTDFSATHIKDLSSWVSFGEKHKVKITQLKLDDSYELNCSRKAACSPKKGYDTYRTSQILIARIGEPIYQDNIITGYFVEVNPIVLGIADITDEEHTFRTGDKVTAIIKKVDPEERKVKLKIL